MISPKMAIYINLVLLLSAAVTSGLFGKPPFMSDYVASCLTWCAGAIGVVGNIVLHALSAPVPGPAVKS